MSRVFIGIGSNEGDRLDLISRALRCLTETRAIRLMQMALITETEPVGGPPQGPYLNTVVEIDTTLSPHELLVILQAIEQRLGRVRSTERWAPRPIDLDVLLYDDRIIQEPHLTVPHPRLHERQFVLEPLAQLAPALLHPILHQSMASLLEQLPTARPTSCA